jgi:hypothetical protein
MPNNQQAILDAFTGAQTFIPDKVDVQHTPLYDTVTWNPGDTVDTTTGQFFTDVGPQSGKSYGQTNMRLSQELPAPEAFSVFGIHVRWQENVLMADLLAVLSTFALEFYIGDKWYQRAPLWFYEAGGGIAGFGFAQSLVAAPPPTITTIMSNGLPGRMEGHRLAINIVLENKANFYAQLVGGSVPLALAKNGGTGLILQVLLDGLYARGVQ